MSVLKFDAMFVGGGWRKLRSERKLQTFSPASDALQAEVFCAGSEDVDAAVGAAAAAFPVWSKTPVSVRLSLIQRIREGIAERADEFAAAITKEMGAPIRFSRDVQVALALKDLNAMLACGDVFRTEGVGTARVVREPCGVVAGITPWNFPLHQMLTKVASALIAGCTIVLKPSEYACFSARMLAEVLHRSGTPAGVFNMVFGDGRTGMALAAHEGVDLVSFTGSQGSGRKVAVAAAEQLKRTILELGGKSANILLDDAEFELALEGAVGQCFANAGQFCACLSRLLIPESRRDEVERRIPGIVADWTLGDPMDPSTHVGPLANRTQQEHVRAHIRSGIEDGALLLAGGAEQPKGFPYGAYVRPTVFGRVTPQMRISREETFGPVLTIQTYGDEDEAVRMANDSAYGLSGGVWSADVRHARAVADRLFTGQVVINGAVLDVSAPFGGVRKSGWGSEYGRYGIEEYTYLKSVLGG